ncbi:MAG: glycosyltransferase family 39 protein [Nitrospirota bacterium]
MFAAAFIFLVSLGLYLFYGAHPLWDSEAMYAEVPREMLLSRHFLYPTLNFAPFLFKPPLFLWANAASQALFGPSELSARLPNALFLACTVLIAFGIGSRLSLKAGIFSGAVLATSYGFVVHASTMLTDIPLATFTAGAVYFFLKMQDGSRRGVYGLYACLALAVMTKGFIGLVFPGIAFAVFILAERRWDVLRAFFSLPGIMIFLAITLPWHLLMEARNPGFLNNFIVHEQVLRFFNRRFPQDIDSVSSPLFILVTLGWLMPWAVYVFQAISRHIRRGRQINATERLALYWGLGGMVFLSLAGSKMEYYCLPVLPAFAILIGSFWSELGRTDGPRLGSVLSGTLLIALTAVTGIFVFPHVSASLGDWLSITASETAALSKVAERTLLLLFIGGSISAYLLIKRRWEVSFAAFFLSALLVSVSAKPALDIVSGSFSSADLAKTVSSISGPGDIVVVDGETEYEFCTTYTYYTGRKVFILENGGMPVVPVRFSGSDRFILKDDEFRALWSSGRRVYLATGRDPVKDGIPGLSAGGFTKVTDSPKALYANLAASAGTTRPTTTAIITAGGMYAGKGIAVGLPNAQRSN